MRTSPFVSLSFVHVTRSWLIRPQYRHWLPILPIRLRPACLCVVKNSIKFDFHRHFNYRCSRHTIKHLGRCTRTLSSMLIDEIRAIMCDNFHVRDSLHYEKIFRNIKVLHVGVRYFMRLGVCARLKVKRMPGIGRIVVLHRCLQREVSSVTSIDGIICHYSSTKMCGWYVFVCRLVVHLARSNAVHDVKY